MSNDSERARGVVLSQVPLLVVLLGVTVGTGLALSGAWRVGSSVIGVAMGVAAVCRGLLTEVQVGLLAVRSRGFDVTLYAGLAVGIVVLAAAVPAAP